MDRNFHPFVDTDWRSPVDSHQHGDTFKVYFYSIALDVYLQLLEYIPIYSYIDVNKIIVIITWRAFDLTTQIKYSTGAIYM